MNSWISALPTLLLLIVVTWGPGIALLLAAGARSRLARVACAPSLTFAVYGIGGFVFDQLGIWWRIPTVASYVFVLSLLVATGRWLILSMRGRRLSWNTWLQVPRDAQGISEPGSGGGAPGEPSGHIAAIAGPRWLLPIAVFVTWMVMISPILPGTEPNVPIQSADSIYHYNQAWLIENTGNASSLTGNSGMYGLNGRHAFYPMVWHEITSLAAFGWNQVVVSTNMMLLVVPLVYLVGLLYLVRVLLPELGGSAWITLGACALIPIYPMRLLMDTAVWPYTLALAACPAIMAWTLAVWRRSLWLWRLHRRCRAVCALAAVFPAYLGLILIHPATFFIIGWPLSVVVWAGMVLSAWRLIHSGDERKRRWGIILAILAVVIIILIVLFVVVPGPQQTHFGRRPYRTWDQSWKKIIIAFLLFYGGGGVTMKLAFVTMFFLCVLGAGVCIRRQRHRGIVLAWLAHIPLIVATMAPIPVLSSLTGVFYNNPHRIKAMTAIPAVLLVTIGLAFGVQWLRDKYLQRKSHTRCRLLEGVAKRSLSPRSSVLVGALVLILGTAATFPGVRGDVQGAFFPSRTNQRFVVSESEKAMIKRMADELPPDALVIGDPVAGTAMLPFLAGVRSVWMFAGQADADTDGWYLRQHFRDIHTDPQVCEILRRHHIRYFYQDMPTYFNGVWLADLRPGLYHVDTNDGFRFIDLGGTARMWEITACDEP